MCVIICLGRPRSWMESSVGCRCWVTLNGVKCSSCIYRSRAGGWFRRFTSSRTRTLGLRTCRRQDDRQSGREGRANSFSVRGILSTSRLYAMTAMSDGWRMDGWLQSAHSNTTVASFGRCGVAWGHSRTGMGEAASETETRRRGKGLDRRECIWLLSLSLPLPLLFCSVTGGAMGQRAGQVQLSDCPL